MPDETFSFKHAINFSSDNNNYFFINAVNDYLVVINHHISVWQKNNGVYELLFNVRHDYIRPHYTIKGTDVTCKHINNKIHPFDRHNIEANIGINDITKLEFKRLFNISVPVYIREWQEQMTFAIDKFENLSIIGEFDEFTDDARKRQLELYDYMFGSSAEFVGDYWFG